MKYIIFTLLIFSLIEGANRLAERFPKSLKKSVQWLRSMILEMVALIAMIGLFLWDWILCLAPVKKQRSPPDFLKNSSKTPVLFIHGYLNQRSAWAFQRWQLEKQELGSLYAVNLGYPFSSIETHAEKVRQSALEIAKETGQTDLIVVGHSMGGLVGSYYALYLAPVGTVKQVITIGSPFRGSPLAWMGIGKCAKQMRKHSSFLKQLRARIFNCKTIRFSCIVSETDEIVPASSALISNQFLLIPDIGHLSLVFSKRVSNKLSEWIQAVS